MQHDRILKTSHTTIPLGTTAPINAPGPSGSSDPANAPTIFSDTDNAIRLLGTDGGDNNAYVKNTAGQTIDNQLYADLSEATAATINQLRLAFATQKFLEIQARGGSRYIEVIKNHFNVTSPDARLQRPEYLGGGSSPVNISPVAQTSSTDATTPQGNLSAIGTTVLSGHSFTKSFTECNKIKQLQHYQTQHQLQILHIQIHLLQK